MRMFDTNRMRKRARAVTPPVRRDRSGNPIHERCGWSYVGELGADMVCVQLGPESMSWAQYAMTREMFDSLSDEEFADRMERALICGTEGTR
jgi:hypothetical protein